jgi:hypothetical protein
MKMGKPATAAVLIIIAIFFTVMARGCTPVHLEYTRDTGVRQSITETDLTAVVPRPVTGAKPQSEFAQSQYTGTVVWTPADTPFQGGVVYTAALSFFPIDDRSLTGVIFTHDEGTVHQVENSITIEFPATEAGSSAVTDLDLSYIGLPTAGEVPTVNGNFIRGQYTGIVLWSPPDPAFAGGTAYSATAILTPKKGYRFEGAGDCVYSASAETVVTQTESGENRVVTLQFPAVNSSPAVDPPPEPPESPEPPAGEKTVIGAVNLNGYIIPPVVGLEPYMAGFTASDQHFSGMIVSWTEGGAAVTGYFLAGKIYQAAVILSAGEGYTFDAAAPVTYDYAAADGVSHSPAAGLSDTLWVSLSFPALTMGRIPVSDFDLAPYFDAPVVGKVPAAVVSGAAFQYSGTVSWTPDPSGSFASETVYTATVHLSPKTGYTFEEVGADAFKHGGSPGTNAAGSGDITIVFPPTEIGHLTLLGTATGKTYTAEVFSSTREIEDYPAFVSATLASNQVASGAGQGYAADAEGLAIFLNAFGGPYTGTGRLLTVRVTDTVTGELEDIYYQPQMPFVNGSAVFDLTTAKSRNRDLLGGAVTFRAALERIWGGESGDFNLTPEDETVDSTWPSPLLTISTWGDRSMNGNGKTITVTKPGNVLTISNGAGLTLVNITLKVSSLTYAASPITIGGTGRLTLDLGATLAPCSIAMTGGKLVMEPGSLVSPDDVANVIPVTLSDSYAEFEMKGGEISGSTSNGVRINTGSFIMTGGTITANKGYGVYKLGGTMRMDYGKISGNGGGVSGTLTMTGGEISGNTSSGGGGGVNGTLTMTGGEISGNTASGGGGGGVSGTLNMNGGEIRGNTSSGGGGGVSGTITMSGGEICGNKGAGGGGVSGTLTMSGGKISGNNALEGYGGGVYATGDFTLNGGEISGNHARNGGGVYVTGPLSSVSLISGDIVKNVASSPSGVYGYGYGGIFFTDTVGHSPADLEGIVRENLGYGSGVLNGGNHNFPLDRYL